MNGILYVQIATPQKRKNSQFHEFRFLFKPFYYIDNLMRFRDQKATGKMDISQNGLLKYSFIEAIP